MSRKIQKQNQNDGCRPIITTNANSHDYVVKLFIHDCRNSSESSRAEINDFRNMKSIKKAIKNAGLARWSNGKKFNHQYRIPNKILKGSTEKLLKKKNEIVKCKKFSKLFELIENTIGHIKGIGAITVYDTSFRIGGKLGIYPDKIYLHGGTLKSAKNLGISTKEGSIKINTLPTVYRKLKPYEIEDCLCIYKKQIEIISKKV